MSTMLSPQVEVAQNELTGETTPSASNSFATLRKAIVGVNSTRFHESASTTQRLTQSQVSSSKSADSGYGSTTDTPENSMPPSERNTSSEVKSDLSRTTLFPRKPTSLIEVDQDIPTPTQNRFRDLHELFRDSLHQHVSKGRSKAPIISMKLRVLGRSREDARPMVVVQCDDFLAKRVKQFFNQPHVKSQYEPRDNDINFPCLVVVVLARLPRLLAARDKIDVFARAQDYHAMPLETMCGLLIRVPGTKQDCFATLGGIVEVTSIDNKAQNYGLTTGHILSITRGLPEINHESELVSDAENCEEQLNTDLDAEDEEFIIETSSQYDQSEDQEQTTEYYTSPFTRVQVPSDTFWKIGHTFSSSYESKKSAGSQDWALLKFELEKYHARNLVKIHNDGPSGNPMTSVMMKPLTEHNSDLGKSEKPVRSIIISNQAGGFRRGIVKAGLSLFMLDNGEDFMRTYDVSLFGNRKFVLGDSGSWIIDEITGEVYGHVVASDVFGEAFVAPLHTTLQQIADRLQARCVKLSTLSSKPSVAITRARADFTAEAVDSTQLSFKAGDAVEIIDTQGSEEEGWRLARHVGKDAKNGWVPSKYLKETSQPAPRALQSFRDSRNDSGYSPHAPSPFAGPESRSSSAPPNSTSGHCAIRSEGPTDPSNTLSGSTTSSHKRKTRRDVWG